MITTKRIKNFIITVLIFLLTFNILSCKKQLNEEYKKEIIKVLYQQRDSWNNGDIEAYMQGYWNSDSLRFMGQSGINYGWETTLNHYKKKYYNKSIMGNLTFKVISLELMNDNVAFMIGSWALKREVGDVSGYFTLIWKKINGKWFITTDHTS